MSTSLNVSFFKGSALSPESSLVLPTGSTVIQGAGEGSRPNAAGVQHTEEDKIREGLYVMLGALGRDYSGGLDF